jgi:hypothetical protein
MGKNEEEKKMMNDEKSRLDNDINKWEKDFEKKNGRKPTEDDKYVIFFVFFWFILNLSVVESLRLL